MSWSWIREQLSSPGVLAGLEGLWILLMAGWILQERRPPVTTLAWILGLSILPVIGIPIYLFLGPRRLKRRLLRRAKARRGIAAESLCRRRGGDRARRRQLPDVPR